MDEVIQGTTVEERLFRAAYRVCKDLPFRACGLKPAIKNKGASTRP